MTSVLGKKKFNNLLGNMVVKNRGKLTLAARDDKRPEVTSAEADFMISRMKTIDRKRYKNYVKNHESY